MTTTPNDLDVRLGEAIRRRRKALNMSQTALAAAIGLTFQQIQKYERGSNRVSFSRLVDIAHTLNCRIADLVGDLGLGEGDVQNSVPQGDTGHLRIEGADDLLAGYAAMSAPLRRGVRRLVVAIVKNREGAEA